MMVAMNKKMTLEALAGLVQTGFLDLAARIDGVAIDVKALTLRVDALEKRMDGMEMRMDGFEKRMDSIEERMENGFYNIMQELQEIRKQIAQMVTRKELRVLEARVGVLEKKVDSRFTD